MLQSDGTNFPMINLVLSDRMECKTLPPPPPGTIWPPFRRRHFQMHFYLSCDPLLDRYMDPTCLRPEKQSLGRSQTSSTSYDLNLSPWRQIYALQWRHNGCDGVSNHQPHDCLLNRLFRRRSKKTSKLRVTGLCAGNSPVTGEFPAQMASNAENVFIWWRYHRGNEINEGSRKRTAICNTKAQVDS